jgi:hypothetical protein
VNDEPIDAHLEGPAPIHEKMEVHHHPEVEKKDFKAYLLEGLMIFIAVMMGFFAESLRENISEHNRAKEYAFTLFTDLKADTADLNDYIYYTVMAAGNVDTLLNCLSQTEPKDIPSGKLYWYGLWGAAHGIFVPHDATLVQMKNSGALRYFGDAALNRKVGEYDQLCRKWEKLQEMDRGIYEEVRKARAKIFEFQYNNAANQIWLSMKNERNAQPKIDSFIRTNPPLLSYDKSLINEYVEMVRSRYIKLQLSAADSLLSSANRLLANLKTEYKLVDLQ